MPYASTTANREYRTAFHKAVRFLRLGHLLIILAAVVCWLGLLGHRSQQAEFFGRFSADWLFLLGIAGALLAGLTLSYRLSVHHWVVSRRRQLILAGVTTFASILMLELGTRVWMSLTVSPYYWQWGMPEAAQLVRFGNVNAHSLECDGYFKFPPNRVLHQGAYSHNIPTRINNLGFRGEDISPHKPTGTFRVLCLGGSSTFGYHATDEGTYPACLERRLNAESIPGGPRFEVINLGVPHLDSTAMVRLFEKEAVPLEPDAVVVYSATNDAVFGPDRRTTAFGQVLGSVNAFMRPKALAWHLIVTGYAKSRLFSEEEIDRRAAQKAETFIDNMARMSHWCSNHEVLFVPVTQQHTSLYGTGRAGELGSTTYEQECTQVRRAIEQDSGTLNGNEAFLLVHQQLTERLRHFSAQQGLPLVDGIDVLDQHRSFMLSWVHLDERANMILATAIAERIREEIPSRVASR